MRKSDPELGSTAVAIGTAQRRHIHKAMPGAALGDEPTEIDVPVRRRVRVPIHPIEPRAIIAAPEHPTAVAGEGAEGVDGDGDRLLHLPLFAGVP